MSVANVHVGPFGSERLGLESGQMPAFALAGFRPCEFSKVKALSINIISLGIMIIEQFPVSDKL